METRYPIRKADGTEYQRYEEVKGKLGNEQVGKWLVADNYLWHGGIHISRVSAPNSVLTEETAERAIPLQCMAGGDIVALRVNEKYKEAPYGEDQKIKYSSTFVLVRSTHTPDSSKPNSALIFYTLYMHLAPLSDYPERNISLVIERNGLKKRTVTNHEIEGQVTSTATEGTFPRGTLVEVGRTLSFTHNGARKDFCTARKIENGKPVGDYFWVAAGEENLQPQSRQRAYLPDWMQEAVRTSTYDSVIIPATTIKIAAGSPIGFLGRDDAPNERDEVQVDWQSHIEVFSNDSRMPRFLSNPENLTSNDKGWIKAKEGTPVFQRKDVENVTTFIPTEKTVSKDEIWRVVEPEQSTPFKDAEGKWWFQFDRDIWLNQESVEELNPYNLIARNFKQLEQPPTDDFSKTLVEPWVSKAFRWFGSTVYTGEEALVKQKRAEWEAVASMIDSYWDGFIANTMFTFFKGNLLKRLHTNDDGIPDLHHRLIVKHDSEWYGKSDEPCWKKILGECGDKERPWLTQWRDDVEWMSQVEGFKEKAQRQLWHFHPLEFLGAIRSGKKWFDIDAFIEIYKQRHSVTFGFYERGRKIAIPALNPRSESSLRDLLNQMKDSYYEYFTDFNEKYIAYMLATIRVESYRVNTRWFFKPIDEDISYEKAEVEYGSGPTAKDPVRARLNHNTSPGDGYKYRGRGLVQLTWKINYEKFERFVNDGIVESPEKICVLEHAVKIMMIGMRDGAFRGGHTLERYLGGTNRDYFNARLIINGYKLGQPDKANEFEDYAKLFEDIINETR